MHKRRPAPAPTSADTVAAPPLDSNPIPEAPSGTVRDAVVLHDAPDAPISVNAPGALTVVASFGLDCAALAAEMSWDASRKCAAGTPEGPSKIEEVDLAGNRYIKARAACDRTLQCQPSDWSAPQPSANRLMRWTWTMTPAEDRKGSGNVLVEFMGAPSAEGPYVALTNIVPPIRIQLTVQDSVDWWADRILKRMKQADAIIVQLTVLIGSLIALYLKLRKRPPQP